MNRPYADPRRPIPCRVVYDGCTHVPMETAAYTRSAPALTRIPRDATTSGFHTPVGLSEIRRATGTALPLSRA